MLRQRRDWRLKAKQWQSNDQRSEARRRPSYDGHGKAQKCNGMVLRSNDSRRLSIDEKRSAAHWQSEATTGTAKAQTGADSRRKGADWRRFATQRHGHAKRCDVLQRQSTEYCRKAGELKLGG